MGFILRIEVADTKFSRLIVNLSTGKDKLSCYTGNHQSYLFITSVSRYC